MIRQSTRHAGAPDTRDVRDAATTGASRKSWTTCVAGATKRLTRYARRFDALEDAIEVPRRRSARPPHACRRDVRAAPRRRPQYSRGRQAPGSTPLARVSIAASSSNSASFPLDRVGCYVPAGRYPLPSSLLMTAIPASAAGVREIVVACPKPAPVVMAAALEARVTRLFRVGGAHAIAALAYGTETIPRVDKIVGPGNRYVAAAKAIVAADCGIDFYAGPTEIVIVASRGRAEWIAADLLAQAEHDPDARAVLITPSRVGQTCGARC